MNWDEWPEAPVEDRPKKLPHAGGIPSWDYEKLLSKGWAALDVRLMPNETDAQRAEAVKSWLEGVRMGVIEADAKLLKFIELECKVYGLSAGKTPAEDNKKKHVDKQADVRTLLSFGSPLNKDNNNDRLRSAEHR